MRVLIVKTSSMGDVLHTLPALTDAMQSIPDLKIDWVVEENFAQIPSWHPAVDRVIPVAIRRWRKNWFRKDVRYERASFMQKLTEFEYDAIIDAQGLIKSALLVTRKAKGPKHGLDWQSAREPLASWFYDIRHRVTKNQHAVERIRKLCAQSLNYTLPQIQGDYAIAQHFLQKPTNDSNQYLVFLHATTRDEKHWPEQHWQDLLEQVKATGLKIKLPWGAPHEYERAQRLAQQHEHVEVLPKLTLSEVATILANAKAVVSVDTGLSHLAAALDKPNVTLYGPTDPGLIGGYGKNQHQIKPADNDMNSITSDDVFTVINNLIS